jgi:hypothetical protein
MSTGNNMQCAGFLLTRNSIPCSSITVCTGILSGYSTTPDREQYTLYSTTSSLRNGIYNIFNAVVSFWQKHD